MTVSCLIAALAGREADSHTAGFYLPVGLFSKQNLRCYLTAWQRHLNLNQVKFIQFIVKGLNWLMLSSLDATYCNMKTSVQNPTLLYDCHSYSVPISCCCPGVHVAWVLCDPNCVNVAVWIAPWIPAFTLIPPAIAMRTQERLSDTGVNCSIRGFSQRGFDLVHLEYYDYQRRGDSSWLPSLSSLIPFIFAHTIKLLLVVTFHSIQQVTTTACGISVRSDHNELIICAVILLSTLFIVLSHPPDCMMSYQLINRINVKFFVHKTKPDNAHCKQIPEW